MYIMPRFKFAYSVKGGIGTKPNFLTISGDDIDMAYNKAVLELRHKFGSVIVSKSSATEQPDLSDLDKAIFRKRGWD